MKTILFNADVGEEAGFDHKIMPYISWCNIACGSHAGNEEVIKKTIDLALKHEVKIGAHPSYPDRKNFGREEMSIPPDELVKSITEQIELVAYHVNKKGGQLHHVKPHGALYNVAVQNESVANSIISAIENIDRSLYIITTEKSKISYLYGKIFSIKKEVFADRNYNPDLTLVSRKEKGAVITDPKLVFEHVLRMVKRGVVKVKNGEEKQMFFDTICVHGDNPKSVEILEYMHGRFLKLGYGIKG